MFSTADYTTAGNCDLQSFFGGPSYQDPSFGLGEVLQEGDACQVTSAMLNSIDLPDFSPVSSASNASNDFEQDDLSGLAALATPGDDEGLMLDLFELSFPGEVDLPIPEGNIICPVAPTPAPEPAPAAISTALLVPAFAPAPVPACFDKSQEPHFVRANDAGPNTISPADLVLNPATVSPSTFAVPALPAPAYISPTGLSLKRKLSETSSEMDPPASGKRRGRPPKKSVSPSDTPSTNSSPLRTVTARTAAATARPSACVPAKFVKEAIEIMGVTADEIKHHVDFDSLMTVVAPERREASLAFGERIANNRLKQAEAAANTRMARAAQMQALETERDEANARASLLEGRLASVEAELAMYKALFGSMNIPAVPQPQEPNGQAGTWQY